MFEKTWGESILGASSPLHSSAALFLWSFWSGFGGGHTIGVCADVDTWGHSGAHERGVCDSTDGRRRKPTTTITHKNNNNVCVHCTRTAKENRVQCRDPTQHCAVF